MLLQLDFIILIRLNLLKCPDHSRCLAANNKPSATSRNMVKASSLRVTYWLLNSTISSTISDGPLKFMHVLSPVYFSVWLFSLLSSPPPDGWFSLFFSVADSESVFSVLLPPFCFVFWLGLLSGASWGNAWSLPVCLCLPSCFPSSVSCPCSYASLQQPSSLS